MVNLLHSPYLILSDRYHMLSNLLQINHFQKLLNYLKCTPNINLRPIPVPRIFYIISKSKVKKISYTLRRMSYISLSLMDGSSIIYIFIPCRKWSKTQQRFYFSAKICSQELISKQAPSSSIQTIQFRNKISYEIYPLEHI